MKLIKNAIVYKAHLPAADLLRKHLEERPFKEMGTFDVSSSGFVAVSPIQDMVATFQGGLAFSVRIDNKILPAAAIKAELAKRLDRIEQNEGRRPGRKESRDIKEQVIANMLGQAFSKTAVITSFYDPENQFLFVPVSSKALADVVVSNLIQAVGSVKTETIHISDIKHGLTTRLKQWLDDDQAAFGPFEPCDQVHLKRDREAVSITMEVLESARQGLNEAMDAQFTVTAMRFMQGSVSFRLTSDFHFKTITFDHEPETDGVPEDLWAHEAAIQVLELSRVVTNLCDLLGYKAPDLADEPAEEAAE